MAMAGLGLGKALISVSEEAIKGGGRTLLLNWYTATEVTLGIVLLLSRSDHEVSLAWAWRVSLTAPLVGSVRCPGATGSGIFVSRDRCGGVAAVAVCRPSQPQLAQRWST